MISLIIIQKYYIKNVSGDSLWSIANKFNTTVDELKRINNLSNNTLQIGQILKLPESTNESSDMTTYIVQRGDSLWSIANKFNTTIDELKMINNLSSNTLQIGQILKLPKISNELPSKQTYTVKKGDSLWSIAQQFNTTIQAIKDLNNLTSNVLNIGDQLYIPTIDNNSTTNDSKTIYTVQRGDSLWLIAQRYNITVDELKKANNLTNNTLQIGDKLIIPNQQSSTYTVQKGDSLWTIANQFNTTVDELKRINNLTSNTLQVGQILYIS